MAISSFTTRDCLQELGYRIAECRAVEQYIYEKQDESMLVLSIFQDATLYFSFLL